MQLPGTGVLARKSRGTGANMRKAIKYELQPSKINRKKGFSADNGSLSSTNRKH
jgi:hypothetical protein